MWDDHRFAQVIEQLDEKTVVMHYEFKPPEDNSSEKPHDFVVVRTERIDPDGTCLILSRSIVHQDVPERIGCIRSEVDMAGFCIKPEGTSQSFLIYVNQSK